MRVLSVASEIYPIIKTGGLADVAGALPLALRSEGVEMRTLVPGYPAVMDALESAEPLLEWPLFFGGITRLLKARCGELDLLVLDAPHLFGRPGNPYVTPEGADWPDNGLRFAALSRMAADIGLGDVPAFVPDIVHAHDWQAGLDAGLHALQPPPSAGTVITVHNLAYQGKFPPEMLAEFGLPPESFAMYGVEYYGDDRLPESRAAIRRPHHHGVADLRQGDSVRPGRHGLVRTAARPRECASWHSQWHRYLRLESGH